MPAGRQPEQPEQQPAQQPMHIIANVRPPLFSGQEHEDCEVHWLKFLDFVDDSRIPQDQQVQKFRTTLNNDARQWYHLNQASFTDLVALKTAFTTTYAKHINRSDLLKQFNSVSLGPSESLLTYKNRVQKLALQAKITDDEMVVMQFIEGLPASVKGIVRARRDNTLEEALKTAQAVYTDSIQTPHTALPVQAVTKQQLDEEIAAQVKALYIANNYGGTPSHSHRQSRDYARSRSDRVNRSQSRDRQSRSNSRNRFNRFPTPGRYSPARDRRYSPARDRRYSPARDRRYSPARDSRSPGRDKKVSFSANQRGASPRPLTCYYCGEDHIYADCPALRKDLRDGKVKSTSHF